MARLGVEISAFAYPSSDLVHGLSRILFRPPTQRTRYEGRNLSALTPVAPQGLNELTTQTTKSISASQNCLLE